MLPVVSLSALGLMILFRVGKLDMMRLYKTLLNTIIVEGAIIILGWHLLNMH